MQCSLVIWIWSNMDMVQMYKFGHRLLTLLSFHMIVLLSWNAKGYVWQNVQSAHGRIE